MPGALWALVVTSLLTGAVVREAVLGPDGAAATMEPGSALVDLSTTAPAESRSLAAALAERGIEMLDAPVSGSSSVVRAGEATVFVGGPEAAFARCRPLFEHFARCAIHAGPAGAGATAKLVTNLVLGLNRLALAEGLALGLRAGLDGGRLLEALRESAAYSRALDAKGRRMIEGRFEPEARLSQHLKDMELILDLASEVGLALPASRLHRELLQEAVDSGLGELDNSAIICGLLKLQVDSPRFD